VFGLSFGELCVLFIVAIVVLGPKDLPRYLRKGGQLAGRLRRLAFEMREKSGIDEVLRTEGIDRDIAEIRRLARGEIGGVMAAVRATADAVRANGVSTAAMPAPATAPQLPPPAEVPVPRPAGPVDNEREYPRVGADAYGAVPDGAGVYDGSFPPSSLAEDRFYMTGEESTEVGEETAAAEAATTATGTTG